MAITDEVANPEPEGESDPLERVVSRRKEDVEKGFPAGVFGYPAGKSIIAKRLIKLFPAHKTYVEPFCGSAAMFFTKTESPVEVLNDQNDEVMHAYKTMRNASKADLEKLGSKNWKATKDYFEKVKGSAPSDALDRLHKFLYLNAFTFGKGQNGGYRHDADGRVSKAVARIVQFQPRLKHATLLHGDYAKAIEKYDGKDAFHFLDPPYAGTSSFGGVGEKSFDEARFRKVMEGIKGKFLLTYGTTDKLDTSGFEVKRMRQPDQVSRMHGGTRKHLTHLLVSNFKIASKSLGAGVELDDVVGILDMDAGSHAMISVPEQLSSARKWEHADDLRAYPAEPGPAPAQVRLRFLEKRIDLDMVFPLNDTCVAWTLDAQRATLAYTAPEHVAKGFSIEGSRFFLPLTKGVVAKETPAESIATAVIDLAAPFVEFGLQTETSHEYFLSKGGECAGQLTLGRGGEGASTLFDAHPWIATFIDDKFIPTAVLKGSPMPPDGVSALPQSIEKVIPPEFRYWEHAGVEARKCRDALIASGFFDRVSVAMVDGEFAAVTTTHALLEAVPSAEAVPSWPLHKAASLLRDGEVMVEVFSPSPETLAKAVDRVAYVDAGDVNDGALGMLAKALCAQPGEYIVTAVESPRALEILKTIGRVFKFRPGDGVSADAVKRLFVASFGVRGDDILWLDKNDNLEGAPNLGDPEDPRKPKLREYNTPSDDTGDLGKSLERLFKAVGSTPRKLLETIGPPNEWSGAVASIIGADNRKAMKDAWDALTPGERADVQARFEANFDKMMGKAEWSTATINDLNDSAFLYIEPGGKRDEEGKTTPRSLRHFPYRDQDGEIDQPHLRNAIAQAPKSKLPRSVIDDVQARGRKILVQHFPAKAEFNNPDPGGAGDIKQPRELDKASRPTYTVKLQTNGVGWDALKALLEKVQKHGQTGHSFGIIADESTTGAAPEFKSGSKISLGGWDGDGGAFVKILDMQEDTDKADFVTGAPGTLQPAVQFDVAGNPKVRERDHEKDRQFKIAKASEDDDEHYVLGIVLEPDVVDAQKDIYSASEVRDAAHKYMAEFQNRGLMHKEIVNGKVDLIESYLAPVDFTIGDQHVKKGTWMMAVRVKDAKLWNECKTGGLTGFSIGGSANRKPDPKADRKYAARKEAAEKKTAFQGIPIFVDRPKGTIQRGIGPDGSEWSREYKTDYGYIPSTKGGDGEGLDVFLGPNGNSPFAYWATQFNKDGDFDEYKLFLGYDSQEEAKKAYTDHIPAKFLHGMREGTIHQIKALLNQEPKESLSKAIQTMLDAG